VLKVTEKAGTQVVIVLGNHDYPSASGRASAVEIFPALDIQGVSIVRKPGLIRVETKSGPVEILCLPWAGRSALISREEYKSPNFLLSSAQTVKIEKVFETPKKTVRSKDFSRNTGVLQALDKYIESKPELKNIAGYMKSYAEKLIKDTE